MSAEHLQLLIGLRSALGDYRFTFATEQRMQEQFEELLMERQIPFAREVRLSKQNRPDFVLWGDVAVEAKMAGSLNGHLRQLKRYAEEPSLSIVSLLCTRPYPLPDLLSGKPCLRLKIEMLS